MLDMDFVDASNVLKCPLEASAGKCPNASGYPTKCLGCATADKFYSNVELEGTLTCEKENKE